MQNHVRNKIAQIILQYNDGKGPFVALSLLGDGCFYQKCLPMRPFYIKGFILGLVRWKLCGLLLLHVASGIRMWDQCISISMF